jgi:hypothetical protein
MTKVLFKLSLRQTTVAVAILPKMVNLNRAVPHDTAFCWPHETFAVQMPFHRADGLRNLAGG